MLLEMCKRFPIIQNKIDFALDNFVRHDSGRGTLFYYFFLFPSFYLFSFSLMFVLVKLAQPDLGELLVYLSVSSKITWRHIAPIFLQGT